VWDEEEERIERQGRKVLARHFGGSLQRGTMSIWAHRS
jgi:hypothetical protein